VSLCRCVANATGVRKKDNVANEVSSDMTSSSIAEMSTPEDIAAVRNLLRQYVEWLFDSFPEETDDLQSYFSPERQQQALDEVSTKFISSEGLALIARREGQPVGCVLAHSLEPGIAEMKRLFVLPSARGHGVGRALIEMLGEKMVGRGYSTIRLDTAVFLTDAISLYRRMGFVEIAPYFSIPAGAAATALFMEWRR
jgi:putative acetyltransferase